MEFTKNRNTVDVKVEKIDKYQGMVLNDLCDATETTIGDDSLSFSIGINRTEPLVRDRLESYWQGVVLVPERQLIIGKIDNVTAAAIQLVKPAPNDQTSAFCGHVENHFVAPWARGHGLAKLLLNAVEKEAKNCGLSILRLNVRASLDSAIKLYESCGYVRWGVLDKYEKVEGKFLSGYFYYKDLHL